LFGQVKYFRASYWYVSIQKLSFSSRLLSACGATPGHVEGPAGEISLGMLWKNEEEQGDM
jgi:hypothetical protein